MLVWVACVLDDTLCGMNSSLNIDMLYDMNSSLCIDVYIMHSVVYMCALQRIATAGVEVHCRGPLALRYFC